MVMRKLLLALSAAAAIAGPVAADARPRRSPEAKHERALDGRVAGEPVDCINLRDVRSSRIIDDTAILYEGTGGTLYLNRPRGGAESLDSWDVLVTKVHGSQLCSIDVVHLYDAGSRMQTGFVMLGDFVPYKRVRADGTR